MRTVFLAVSFFLSFSLFAQPKKGADLPARPKLIVGIMVDQMRWDFLYRYYDRYSTAGGFRRIMRSGFLNEQALIPYAPTVTACGHATVYTGTVPAIHGIVGNAWWGRDENRTVYCSEDRTVKTVGSSSAAGEMSPRNMFTGTICDELKLATNFRSKVIGIAIKDRGAILPAGHAADAAYWYDGKTGQWITSTYYRQELPRWVKAFNDARHPDLFYQQGWNTLYPIDTYRQSDQDVNDYESTPFGKDQKGFPYMLSQFVGKNYGAVSQTPYGNSMTFMMAMEAVREEEMGLDSVPDFLALSFSSPDYIGHAFGPNSIEVEDTYLRFDIELGKFLDHLDRQVGKDQYVLFLTADHGVAHVPGFMQKNRLPAGTVDDEAHIKEMNQQILQRFGLSGVVKLAYNYQFTLDQKKLDSPGVNKMAVLEFIRQYSMSIPGIDRIFPVRELELEPLPSVIRERLANGYHPRRSGDLQVIFRAGWIDGGPTGTTHGLWNPYDSHIPLMWYGKHIQPGRSHAEVYMTDIAPTLASLLRIQMPNGCIGRPILSVLGK